MISPDTPYRPADDRYDARPDGWFRRCGNSGLMLPAVSLGCWHNFGDPGTDSLKSPDEQSMHANCQAMLFTAFDKGITHFDLANNYGPAPGAAETRVGRILKQDFAAHRDELVISSKAGHRMWPGPYGDLGSRKYLIASCDQSLQRLQLDYVDLFYHHRPDPNTPLEESLGALDTLVRHGKALYTGISSYSAGHTAEVLRVCEDNGLVKPIIHQPNYSMLNRNVEQGLTDVCHHTGLGTIAFCPLAQGLLTDKYLQSVPDDSRANQPAGFLKSDRIDDATRDKLNKLNDVAQQRGQALAQLALAWVLRDQTNGYQITTALIGASRPPQVEQCAACLDAGPIDSDTARQIDDILND